MNLVQKIVSRHLVGRSHTRVRPAPPPAQRLETMHSRAFAFSAVCLCPDPHEAVHLFCV